MAAKVRRSAGLIAAAPPDDRSRRPRADAGPAGSGGASQIPSADAPRPASAMCHVPPIATLTAIATAAATPATAHCQGARIVRARIAMNTAGKTKSSP